MRFRTLKAVATFILVLDGETRTVNVDKPVVTVGRSSSTDLQVTDIRVSRHHCTFRLKDGVMSVQDEGSQNGTFVNGALVEGAALKPGDRVDVGSSQIYFERMPQDRAEDEDVTWAGVDPDKLYKAPLPPETDQLARIQRIASALNSEMDLDRILDLIMDHVVEMAQAERGFLVLIDGNKLTVPVARNFQKEDVMNPEVGFSRSIAERVARKGEAVLTVDATSDDRFAAFASIHEIAPRSVLCMPFKRGGRAIGVVYIDNRIARGVFGHEHLRALQSFADLASGAILRGQLERERDRALEREKAMYAELKNKYEEQGGKLQEIQKALELRTSELLTKYSYSQIIGESASMRRIFQLLDKVVESEEPVLIEGENGTGKELIARAIHYNGTRQKGPFIAENVAAIPETLVESELFGHMRGSFTGADRDKPGLFELADGGTLFLDEVGDMPTDVQKKLLRVLQEREVRRVGGKKTHKVNVRIISATNRELRRLAEQGEFRDDLFYRLRVLSISLPALRDRRDDIPVLVAHFLKTHTPSGLKPKQITPAALNVLQTYDWPGNIRELENEVKRLIAVAGDVIHEEDLSDSVRKGPKGLEGLEAEPGEVRNLDELVAQVEVREIRRSLTHTEGNKTKAAELLGISRFTLQRKMEKYGLT